MNPALLPLVLVALQSQAAPRPGEPLPDSAYGESWIETMDEVHAREAARAEPRTFPEKGRAGRQGRWEVPSRRWTRTPHSGVHYAAPKWGDTRMGIGFGAPVQLEGVWVNGHMDPASWTTGLRVIGYRDGGEVARSAWFEGLEDEPRWFAIDLEAVDRVVFEARPVEGGAGHYGIDDLTFSSAGERHVVDFEDLPWRTQLTGSGHFGLTWEQGSGDFSAQSEPHRPVRAAEREELAGNSLEVDGGVEAVSVAATAPNLVRSFAGPVQSDPGAAGVPDTMGAIGTEHFVVPLNFHLSIYDRDTEARLSNTTIAAFFNTSETVGDPRVVFDHHEGRWIVLASDWSSKLWLAYSLTDDAMGAWFKTSVNVSLGSDAGAWPDYPTLGVDENGIYSAALMVGGGFTMSIYAIDKTPLLQASPSVSVTAWRQLPYEEAIQPCVTFGSGSGEYFVSRASASSARLRRVDPPLSAPTLTEVGLVTTQVTSPAPNAPSQGAGVPMDTHSGRHMNAVYRNGSLWTAHAVGRNGRSAVGWYEFDAAAASVVQQGFLEDPVQHLYVPSVAVNAAGDVLLGFSASSSSKFVSAWFSGRSAGDAQGEMAPAAEYAAGSGAFNQFGGTQRWGDYTMASVDPRDDAGLWTIQQVAGSGNQWNMHVGEFEFGACVSPVTTYCTAKTSSSGCLPQITGSGVASASASSGFTVSATQVEALNLGIFFFGSSGPASASFQGGFLCVAPPVNRLPAQSAGGAAACSGVYTTDFNAFLSANFAGAFAAGTQLNVQAWFRDPAEPTSGTGLSGGLSFTLCP